MKFNSNKTMPKDEAKPSVYFYAIREYPAISLINEKQELIGLFCLGTAIAKRYKQIQRITKKIAVRSLAEPFCRDSERHQKDDKQRQKLI